MDTRDKEVELAYLESTEGGYSARDKFWEVMDKRYWRGVMEERARREAEEEQQI
mgnify:CR=1 FL=1